MNNDTNKLIPELRFPIFKNEGEWEINTLSSFSDLITEKTGIKKYKLLSVTAGIGLVSQMEKFGREIAGESYKNYYVIKKGDFAYNKSSVKIHPEGQIALLEKEDSGAVPNSIFTCFRVNDKIVLPIFLKYPFENNIHGKWLRNFISIGARANGALNVDNKDLLSLPITFPSLSEQQKIASFLSSLDEVITAQADKLVILKTYKKGLMQNLFPQEGEKVPKLRFKEFEKDGDWKEKKLNELGDLINGLTYSPNDVREKGLLVLRSSNIQNGVIDLKDCVYVKDDIKGANPTKSNDILVCVRNGSKNLIGKNAIIPQEIPRATHGAFMTVFRAKNPEFVFQLFQTDFYDKQVQADLGATINSINGKNFMKYKFPVPENPKEQYKIAETLSSLDMLIKKQSITIDQLKAHKKGLMQGLFPKIN